MNAEAAYLLIQAAIASSAAVLLVIGLRKVLRRAIGARAAYWSWLLVPAAALVVLLPQPEQSATIAPLALSGQVRAAVANALMVLDEVASPADYAAEAVVLWAFGALLSLALMLRRQRAFTRSLGEMARQADGSWRASRCYEPLLLGILRPRLVLPLDFETRYAPAERAVVLAHEHAHQQRLDPQVNAIAAAWLCLSWFNPLMHWAMRLFRFDQELACDASALVLSGATRRSYADALLKTQLSADAARRQVVMGCHWHASHPLTERIHMLKHPLPGELRRRSGLVLMFALVLSGCYAVRTAQSQVLSSSNPTPIAINMKAIVNGVDVFAARGAPEGWNVLTDTAGHFAVGDNEYYVYCTARLPPSGSTSVNGESVEGQLVLSCEISDGRRQVFATPVLVVRDGEGSWMGVTDPTRGILLRLGFNASTSQQRVAALESFWKK